MIGPLLRPFPRPPFFLALLAMVAAFIGAATPATTALTPSTAPIVVARLRTAHYDLSIETLDIHEVADLVEQFHQQLSTFFGGRAPEGILPVAVFATRERFEAALAADHQPVVKAGGYYSPGRRKVYLFIQPSEYFTRQLLLHECAHQFHFLVATDNRPPALGLYTEGLAEQLAMHDWDGKHLRSAVIPSISLEDYPATAMAHFTGALHRNLKGMLDGSLQADRPEAWAMCHFLAESYPEQWRAWCDRLDHHASPADALNAVFGDGELLARLPGEFEQWLHSHQQPWRIATIAWQQRGDSIEGQSPNNTVGIAILKQPAPAVQIEMRAMTKPAMAGLVVNYKSPDDYRLLQLMSNRRLRLLRRDVASGWITDGSWRATGSRGAGADVFQVLRKDNNLELKMNGRLVTSVPADGQMGVHIQQGRVRFHVVGD